ncbi:hypothetical protein VTL71DRAFT_2757 [Oculimacula yallundae]|uniref:Uncharacterized protein n=1 Tax=Oculimacula yallundae TaxID=86028 RepID=A0ABR4CA73_9HELO
MGVSLLKVAKSVYALSQILRHASLACRRLAILIESLAKTFFFVGSETLRAFLPGLVRISQDINSQPDRRDFLETITSPPLFNNSEGTISTSLRNATQLSSEVLSCIFTINIPRLRTQPPSNILRVSTPPLIMQVRLLRGYCVASEGGRGISWA